MWKGGGTLILCPNLCPNEIHGITKFIHGMFQNLQISNSHLRSEKKLANFRTLYGGRGSGAAKRLLAGPQLSVGLDPPPPRGFRLKKDPGENSPKESLFKEKWRREEVGWVTPPDSRREDLRGTKFMRK